MGFILGLIKRLILLAVYVVLIIAFVTVIPNLPPYTKFTSFELEPTLPLVGPLKLNDALNNAEKLYNNKLTGPEAFQLHKGEVYTTLGSGEVVKLSPGGHVTFVTKIGEPCAGIHQEQICGRPLGFAIDEKNDNLIVADAYYGIWKVCLKTDKKTLYVSPRVEIDGRAPKVFNALALAKNGDIYWTDSSSDFHLKDGAKMMFSDPSGRLLHYDVNTNRSKVLVDNIWLANGVVLSPDNQFVVVAESSRLRLLKHYIAGPKKGKTEVFLAGLPGIPDNLRELPDGSGLLVALFAAYDEDSPILAKSLAKAPVIRKFVARVISLLDLPFEFLNSQFPHILFETAAYHIGNFRTLGTFLPGLSGLLQVDWDGNIVASYYNTDGSLQHVSDVIVFEDKLLIGTPHGHDFVGAVPVPPMLKKAFASKNAKPKTVEPVTKQAPKPTPKPTEAPKPKAQEKGKEEVKKEAPKVAKPVAQEPPKPAQAKPVEPVKATTPKPVVKKPAPTPAPTTKPPPKEETKPKAQTEQVKSTTPSPKATPPKQEKVQPAKPAQTPPQKAETKKSSEPKPTPAKDNAVPKEIPIKEDIPSDTIKPNKEKLKVIKREGPTEIPNPHV